jgi:hypothetical protein
MHYVGVTGFKTWCVYKLCVCVCARAQLLWIIYQCTRLVMSHNWSRQCRLIEINYLHVHAIFCAEYWQVQCPVNMTSFFQQFWNMIAISVSHWADASHTLHKFSRRSDKVNWMLFTVLSVLYLAPSLCEGHGRRGQWDCCKYDVKFLRRLTTFSGYQPCQLVKSHRRFRNHVCSHHQGYDVTGTETDPETSVTFNRPRTMAREGFINECGISRSRDTSVV